MTLSQASMRPACEEEPKYILLVEDELLVRLALAEELRELGYRVVEAFDADEALVVLRCSLPDLVITDVRMPGSMDGLALLSEIRQRHSKLPVIVMSGHLEAKHAVAEGAAAFLPKPFASETMVDAVKSVLAARL